MQNSKATIFFIYLNQFISILFGIIMVPFYIKNLGLDIYGYIALFSFYSIVISNLDFGLFSSINKVISSSLAEKEEIPSILGFIESLVLLIGFFIFLIFSICFFSSDSFKTELTLIVFIVSVWGCIKLLDNLYRQTLFGLQLQKFHSQLNVILTILKAVGIYLLIKFIEPLFAYYLIGTLIPLIIGIVFFRKKIKKKFSYSFNLKKKKFSNELIGISKKFFLINILGQVLLQIDKISVYIFSLDMNSFGFYALGITVAGMVLTAVAPIQQYLFSKLPSIYDSKNILKSYEYFSKSFKIIYLILFLSIMCFPIISPKVLSIWLEDLGSQYSLFFQVYIVFISYILLSLLQLNVMYLQVTISPKKGIRIICFSIVSYLFMSILAYFFNKYNPILILFSSYFIGYIYSKYILFIHLKKKNLLDEFIKLEFIFSGFVLISVLLVINLENLYSGVIENIYNQWYISFTTLFIISLFIVYRIQKKYKLI